MDPNHKLPIYFHILRISTQQTFFIIFKLSRWLNFCGNFSLSVLFPWCGNYDDDQWNCHRMKISSNDEKIEVFISFENDDNFLSGGKLKRDFHFKWCQMVGKCLTEWKTIFHFILGPFFCIIEWDCQISILYIRKKRTIHSSGLNGFYINYLEISNFNLIFTTQHDQMQKWTWLSGKLHFHLFWVWIWIWSEIYLNEWSIK